MEVKMKSKLKFVLACIGFIFFSTPATVEAVERLNIAVIQDAWDKLRKRVRDIEWECSRTNAAIHSSSEWFASMNKVLVFEPKAQSLKPTEFESNEEFKARVSEQEKADVEACEHIEKARVELMKMYQEQVRGLSEQCVELTNAMRQAICERDNFRNLQWTWDAKMDVSDIPYFNRESMSFEGIPCPLATYEDKENQLRIDVEPFYEKITIKFSDIKCAQVFKEGVASGALEVKFHYEFSVAEPQEYTFRRAWTEKKPNAWKEVGKALGAAIMFAQIANGNRGFYQDDIARIEADDTHDLIEHPATMGKAFSINVNKCQVHVKGGMAKSLGMKLDSLSKKWEIVVE